MCWGMQGRPTSAADNIQAGTGLIVMGGLHHARTCEFMELAAGYCR